MTDLAWLFEEADAAVGLRSGHGALVARLSGIWTTAQSTEMSTRALEAAARTGRVLRRLSQLSAVDRRVLRAAYLPRPLDRALVSKHGSRLAALLSSRLGPREKARRESWAVVALMSATLAYRRAL